MVQLSPEERCIAIINNGNQCSRRRKYNHFCGKHNKKQQFGVVSNNIITSLLNTDFIEVKKIKINGNQYLIDRNQVLFNIEKNKIIGKLKKNKIITI